MASEKDFFKEQKISSEVKAKIVAEYFPQYCKILLKKPQKSIVYLDLFSGPGIYEDGKETTPLLIGKACANDPVLSSKVQMLFNDEKHIETLQKNFLERYPEDTFYYRPKFENKTVGLDEKIKKYLGRDSNPKVRNPNPALLFFDPFGYKEIETLLLAKFLGHWGNEIFLFINAKRINQNFTVAKVEHYMQRLFPTTHQQLISDRQFQISPNDRIKLIVDGLIKEFEKAVKFKIYNTAFKFIEEDSIAVSHYILHLTKSDRGYAVIKTVYNSFDNIGAVADGYDTYMFDAKKSKTDVPFDFEKRYLTFLSNLILTRFKGLQRTTQSIYDELQKENHYTYSHYTDTFLYIVNELKSAKASFTDGLKHRQSVVISDTCILNFDQNE